MYAMKTAVRARWRVAWKQNGRVVGKTFGEDFSGARELYEKVIKAEKKGATLISTNVCFPPPPRLCPYKKDKVEWSIVTRKGRRAKKKTVLVVTVHPMNKLNLKGIWWCGYCSRLRKFERLNGFKESGVYVAEPGYHCPICKVSHRDGGIRKWNYAASRIYANPGKKLLNIDGNVKKRKRR